MSPRFDLDARDAAAAQAYFAGRATQMLHDDEDWRWSGVVTPLLRLGVEWGAETLLHDRGGAAFVSVYVYAGHRGQGHLRRHARLRPPDQRYVTTPGCGIFDALAHLDPRTVLAAPLSGRGEYEAIERHYGATRARRSGVPYMNHIDEGLRVLHRWLGASDRAKRAWCLHPLVQGDADLRRSHAAGLLDGFEPASTPRSCGRSCSRPTLASRSRARTARCSSWSRPSPARAGCPGCVCAGASRDRSFQTCPIDQAVGP